MSASGGIVFDRVGEGPPVVLIHPVGTRRQTWDTMVKRLRSERELIAVDLPGFGKSPRDGRDPSPYGYATRMEEFFDELGLDKPHVAGCSLGGGIALELGNRGAVRTVTAFSPIGFWSPLGGAISRTFLKTTQSSAGLTERLPNKLAVALGRPSLRIASAGTMSTLTDEQVLEIFGVAANSPGFQDAVDAFAGFQAGGKGLEKVPVTIAWGDKDLLLTYRTQSKRARKALPNAEHVTLHGCGHLPWQDDLEACAKVVLDRTRE